MMQPLGDAVGMRQAASELTAKADRLAGLVRQVDAQVAPMTYAGPAADRFRADIASQRSNLVQTQGILRNTAEVLMQAASSSADAARPI